MKPLHANEDSLSLSRTTSAQDFSGNAVLRTLKLILRILFIGLFFLLATRSEAQLVVDHFFIPRDAENLGIAESNQSIWELKPIAQIPAIKIVESTRDDAELDAFILASAGGGVTIQRTIVKDGKNYASFSWSPFTFLLSGDTSKDGSVLDLSWVSTFGVLNNIIQVGVGRDFGTVPNDRSRWFLVLSAGVNLTNN